MCKYDSGKEFEHLIMMHLLCVQFLFVICYIWYLLPIYLYKRSEEIRKIFCNNLYNMNSVSICKKFSNPLKLPVRQYDYIV